MESHSRRKNKHKIGIIGAGWVGTACDVGFSMVPGVQISVHDKYKPSDSLDTTVRESEILFICLPTPMGSDGQCDISIIAEVLQQIQSLAQEQKVIVIKSTVPPGTTEFFQGLYPNHVFVFNPEFLTERNFTNDFINQKNVILGYAERDSYKLESFYHAFSFQQVRPAYISKCKAREAEMLKYATNCFLATKVIFFNEIHQICQKLNVDLDTVTHMMEDDERIGKTHMQVPGPDGQFGFGGSCFSKDINALIYLAKELNVDPIVLESSWVKNLMVREHYDWENLAQVNGQYKSNA